MSEEDLYPMPTEIEQAQAIFIQYGVKVPDENAVQVANFLINDLEKHEKEQTRLKNKHDQKENIRFKKIKDELDRGKVQFLAKVLTPDDIATKIRKFLQTSNLFYKVGADDPTLKSSITKPSHPIPLNILPYAVTVRAELSDNQDCTSQLGVSDGICQPESNNFTIPEPHRTSSHYELADQYDCTSHKGVTG